LFVAIMAVAAALAHATDLTVGPSGSGAQFSSIQAAVDAAQPGDRVIVLAGEYNGAVVVNKPIDLVGAGSPVTFSRSYAVFVPGLVPTPITVGNIATGARARISGITFGTIGAMLAPNLSMMTVHDCLGRVELSDVVLTGASLPALESATLGGILHVRDCAQVVASGVGALGSVYTVLLPVMGEASLKRGHAGFLVERSGFWMNDCRADGNATRLVSSGFGGDGGPGLMTIDASVQIARSLIRGAQSGGHQNGVFGFGGAAIDVFGSTVLVHGASPNALFGALPLEFDAGAAIGLGAAGSAIKLDGTSSVTYAPDVPLVPGSGAPTLPDAPAIAAAAGAIVAPLTHRLPTVVITPATVPPGATLTVLLQGEPNLDYIRAVGPRTSPAVGLSGVSGKVLVDLTTLLFFDVRLLDASGAVSSTVNVPADPALAGLEVVEQAAQVLPAGIALSPPSVFSIGF
jgi:hypothetical protein